MNELDQCRIGYLAFRLTVCQSYDAVRQGFSKWSNGLLTGQGGLLWAQVKMASFWSPFGQRVCCWLAGLFVFLPVVFEAIEVRPTPAQIQAALEKGKATAEARKPPDRLYEWFGSFEEFEPRVFLMTKVSGLAVLSTHFALRSESPSNQDIQRILDERDVLISVMIWGDSPRFAMDGWIVMIVI